jgi:hypothetical protein
MSVGLIFVKPDAGCVAPGQPVRPRWGVCVLNPAPGFARLRVPQSGFPSIAAVGRLRRG